MPPPKPFFPSAELPSADLAAAWKTVRARAHEHGFTRMGVAELKRPVTIDLYRTWIEKGFAGEMEYLERHLPEKERPEIHFDRARAALVVAVDYVPHPEPLPPGEGEAAWAARIAHSPRVARYSRGRDYHRWLSNRLKKLAETLRADFPSQQFLCCADSAPILERDLAVRAGLGWVGKNTCVIDRDGGSLFLIGEIVTTMPSNAADFVPHDHCGTCTRCIDACPTGALVATRELDARRCISYLSIESRKAPPLELRAGIGDWLFGCDICQTVCPWNIKAHGAKLEDPVQPRESLIEDLRWIMTSTNRGLERSFARTPLSRAQGTGLKRNALVVAGNRKLFELRSEIQGFLLHPRLSELARWAMAQITDDVPPSQTTSS